MGIPPRVPMHSRSSCCWLAATLITMTCGCLPTTTTSRRVGQQQKKGRKRTDKKPSVLHILNSPLFPSLPFVSLRTRIWEWRGRRRPRRRRRSEQRTNSNKLEKGGRESTSVPPHPSSRAVKLSVTHFASPHRERCCWELFPPLFSRRRIWEVCARGERSGKRIWHFSLKQIADIGTVVVFVVPHALDVKAIPIWDQGRFLYFSRNLCPPFRAE